MILRLLVFSGTHFGLFAGAATGLIRLRDGGPGPAADTAALLRSAAGFLSYPMAFVTHTALPATTSQLWSPVWLCNSLVWGLVLYMLIRGRKG